MRIFFISIITLSIIIAQGGLKIIEKKAMDKDAILCFFNYLQEHVKLNSKKVS